MCDIDDLQIQYKRLGQYFHLRPSDIKKIEYQYDRDPWSALNNVVHEWLKWNFDRTTEDGKVPTRRWLMKAVKKMDTQLADKLEKKYTV